MKNRISATVDKKTIDLLNELIKSGEFRNKSHVIEKSIELISEIKNDKNKK